MTADRAFHLLVGLAALAIFAPLVLAYRLLPCGDVGGLAIHAVGAACRLLGEAGLRVPLPVGIGLTLVSVAAVAIGLVKLGRELVGAHRLRDSLEAHHASERVSCLEAVVSRAGLKQQPRVVEAAGRRAVCMGLLRPRLYLTTGLLSHLGEPELEAVVRHEAHHAARRDPLRIALARAVARSAFYLPVLHDLAAYVVAAMEIEADRVVVAGMGGRRELAAAMLALLPASAPDRALPAAFDVTAARIDALAADAVPRLRLSPWRLGLSAVAVLAGICLLFG